jgi:hypothetical protein
LETSSRNLFTKVEKHHKEIDMTAYLNIDNLTYAELKQIAAMFGGNDERPITNGMIGKFVIVRCHDAGVHAGYLESYTGRECVLRDSRRLWYWKPANGAAFLSGVATEGLDNDSKVGAPIRVHLTENCEIIECSPAAEKSINGAKSYEP